MLGEGRQAHFVLPGLLARPGGGRGCGVGDCGAAVEGRGERGVGDDVVPVVVVVVRVVVLVVSVAVVVVVVVVVVIVVVVVVVVVVIIGCRHVCRGSIVVAVLYTAGVAVLVAFRVRVGAPFSYLPADRHLRLGLELSGGGGTEVRGTVGC